MVKPIKEFSLQLPYVYVPKKKTNKQISVSMCNETVQTGQTSGHCNINGTLTWSL